MSLVTNLTDATAQSTVHAQQHNLANTQLLSLGTASTHPASDFLSANGVTISGTPTTGQILTATSTTTAGWATPTAPGGTNPIGPAGGDLNGTYPNPSVARIAGIALSGTPSTGQVLTATSPTAAAWSTPTTPSTDQAWQFRPETYGTAGDGFVANDVVTNGTQTFTSTVISSRGAIGQWVMIDGGRATNDTAAMGQITGISGTSVTISNPTMFAGAALSILSSASALHAIVGTDCTAAIRSAVNAASTYAQANNYYAEILFKDKLYVVAGAPVQTNASPAVQNAQIPVPYPANNARKLIIAFRGAGCNTALQFWGASNGQITGSVIASVQTAPGTLDATYGPQSILGCPTSTAGFTSGGANPNWVNVKPVVEGIEFVMPVYTHMTAMDFTWAGGCKVDASVNAFAAPLNGNGVLLNSIFTDASVFGSRLGVGLRTPASGNNADIWIPDFAVEGITTGIEVQEHARIGNLKTIYNGVAVRMVGTNCHTTSILGWTAEAYQVGLQGVNLGPYPVDIRMVTEGSSATWDINDSNNAFRGHIWWYEADASPRVPTVNLGANVKIIAQRQAPGYWSTAPAVPATGVAVTSLNLPFRDALVDITAGGATITGITIDGQSTGLTANGLYMVPCNKSISISYTGGPPTWKWWLF